MRDAERAPKRVTDCVACADTAAAARAADGKPHAELAGQPRVEIVRVLLGCEKTGIQVAQADLGERVGIRRALGIAKLLHGVIDRLHARRKPEPFGRLDVEQGIQNNRSRSEERMKVSFLGPSSGVRYSS